jgi:hypothetical protein
MAQTNYTPISLYYSTTASAVPTAANLVQGELAINTNDGKLYYEDSSGVVQVLATKSTGSIGGSNTQVQFNNSGSLGGSSGLTWDGSFLTTSSIKNSALTSGRVTYAGASGLLSDSANLTWNGTNLGVTGTLSATSNISATAGGFYSTRASGNSPILDLTQTGVYTWDLINTATTGLFSIRGNSTAFLSITSSTGNIGMGTPSPSARLGILAGSMNSQILLGVSTSNAAYGSISLNGNSADNGRLGFTGGGSGDNTLYIDVPTSGAYGFRLGGTNVMTINSSGIVTMGAYGAGAATFSASGVISSVSDETWKTKDGVPTNPDAMIQKLEPGYWFYNEEKAPTFGQDRQLGFYAQNVHEAIGSEAAPTPEEGKPWGYYDRSVLAIAVMSLKNALNTIEELKQRITILENK